ncbi:hypothetical protein COU60_03560 [Candidatus Pacearchaeota archaeon CG10_big_fil_rev_8_21_14_0_10_34_76]|nr:MAG: hypothetical protein COU60_03560 [Candidatus Pacearchaeota archaeon CG10_big_fil_rev_8_21_14_0_10_34_76]
MNPFLVLEGVDAAGKTTVGNRLAQIMPARYFKTPGDEFASMREYIDDHAPPPSKLLFYLSSVVDVSARIGSALENSPAICDRYIWSTLVPHAAYHGENLEELECIWRPLVKNLVQPDHVILLQVSEEEQLRRLHLAERINGKQSASDRFCLNTETRRRVRGLYDSVAEREGWLKIDTTHKSVEEVIEEINSRFSLGVLA